MKQRGWIISERILIRRDEICEDESSLEENFDPQGWNQWGRIISGRGFFSAGMKSARKNHPWKIFLIRRDEISSVKAKGAFSGYSIIRNIIHKRKISQIEITLHPVFFNRACLWTSSIINSPLGRHHVSAGCLYLRPWCWRAMYLPCSCLHAIASQSQSSSYCACNKLSNSAASASFSPLPFVLNLSSGKPYSSKIWFLSLSRSACLVPSLW